MKYVSHAKYIGGSGM